MSDDIPIGIILVAHGKYGSAILHAAESIIGSQNDCVSIGVESAHDVEVAVQRLHDAAERLDKGEGVLVLTDMFGGNPTNLALGLPRGHKAEVVTGMNLPMLLKVFENRCGIPLNQLAKLAGDAGRAGIVVTGQIPKARSKEKGARNTDSV